MKLICYLHTTGDYEMVMAKADERYIYYICPYCGYGIKEDKWSI